MKSQLTLLNVISKITVILLVCLMAVLLASHRTMAFTWTEIDDAGDLPYSAQIIDGDGPLEFIAGYLESPTDADMYEIYLPFDAIFSATTVGWTEVDTQLSLFDSSGMGIYSNDDTARDIFQSTLPERSLTAGFYYLAISDWDWDPVSIEGYIFPSHYPFLHFRTAVEEPTDVGGGSPITGWKGLSTRIAEDASYTIALTIDFISVPVPEPLAIDIKPGSDPNSINPRSKGRIPVAILSSLEFYAPAVVDAESLTFGAQGDEKSLAFCNPISEDVNDDGYDDIICHFYTPKTGFQCGDTVGVVNGWSMDGSPLALEGSDSVRIVPSACKDQAKAEKEQKK